MFRFKTRDLLWLMVVVGMACGWWLDHRLQWQYRLSNSSITSRVNQKLVQLQAHNEILWRILDDKQRAEASENIRKLNFISTAKTP